MSREMCFSTSAFSYDNLQQTIKKDGRRCLHRPWLAAVHAANSPPLRHPSAHSKGARGNKTHRAPKLLQQGCGLSEVDSVTHRTVDVGVAGTELGGDINEDGAVVLITHRDV